MIDRACKIPLDFDSYDSCVRNLIAKDCDLKHISLLLEHDGVSFNFSHYLGYCYKKANHEEINVLLKTVKFVRDHDCYFDRDWWSYVADLRADLYTSLVSDLVNLERKDEAGVRAFLFEVINQNGLNNFLNFEYKWRDLDEIYLLDDLILNLLLIELKLNMAGENSVGLIGDFVAGAQAILLEDAVGSNLMASFFKWLDSEQAMIVYANENRIMVNHCGEFIL